MELVLSLQLRNLAASALDRFAFQNFFQLGSVAALNLADEAFKIQPLLQDVGE